MLKKERHDLIVSYVNKYGTAKVEDLIDVTKTSPITVRRDFQELHDEGRITKVHGGAVKIDTHKSKIDVMLKARVHEFTEEKEAVAQKAAAYIEEDMHIYLDAGTTTAYLIPFFKEKNVKLYTHGLHHVPDLLANEIDTYIIGGQLKKSTIATVGEEAVKVISKLHFDVAFIGANAVDETFGYSTPDNSEAIIKQLVIAQSDKAYVLADSTKLNQKSYVSFGKLDDAMLITND